MPQLETPEHYKRKCKDLAEKAFRIQPLAFFEEPEEEHERMRLLRKEDPIMLQDVLNTSRAFVQAVKDEDLEELKRIVKDAEVGELLQVFVLQALVMAMKGAMLEIVREMVNWGVSLQHDQLTMSLHLVCEGTNRENFSNSWRILQLLTDGNNEGRLHVDAPRLKDGWTPLCIACADACLPLTFKLLEMEADPNVITRVNETPLGIAKRKLASDTEEQKEARVIISNMLRHYGGMQLWKDAMSAQRKPRRQQAPKESEEIECEDGTKMQKQVVSSTHTRFSA